MASKGKASAGKDKRKRGVFDDDKTGGGRKKNRAVLQFFDDEAGVDDSDSSFDIDDLFDDDDLLFDFDSEPAVKSDPGKSEQFRGVFPKEEELSGDELEQMLEERYRSESGYVRYAEDGYDNKRSVDRSFLVPSAMEPGLWKVKCKVGRERHTVFCLMQKYVDLKVLGTKLQIISAFTAEHVKGFVFIEAEKQSDVAEACNQIADVYFSLMTQVPPNEVSQLLVVRKRCNEVKEGTWARVKNGIYRGDIAQVVAFNNERKRATVKLIPRVDMQALAAKYGGAGGKNTKKSKRAIPAARLISSTELDEFRPLMQCRRDRDTGKIFEFLDGLMLKDGFVYKKVSVDSLSFWDVKPTEEELQKFTLPTNDESDNLEWLSQLYGEEKKKNNLPVGKGGEKGEGSSGSNDQSSFEVHDLVLFGKREFGMVIGMEKDEDYKILQCAAEGPKILNLGQKDLKYVPLDKKFTALDLHMKTLSVNDTVRILHGPSKDRQGTVKQIYRGIIFLYDENDFENAYFCAKSPEAEKVRHIDSASHGKDEGGPSGFEDAPSSPKSPLSTRRPWQMREDDRGDKDGMFSIGQSLRIRIGPLKGYLCRVLAVRFSDVTVKLDSQQKVLTVKREHLSEVRGKGSSTTMGDDTGLDSSFKPFDLLASDGNANGWLQGASGTTDGDGWNVGGHSGERTAWPSFSSSGALIQGGTSAAAGTGSVDNDSGKDADGWLSKAKNSGNSSWGAGNSEVAGSSGQAGGWGSSDGGWGKSGTGVSNSGENSKLPVGDQGGSWNAGSNMDRGKEVISDQPDPWDKGKKIANETGSWGKQTTDKGLTDSWNKGQGAEEAGGWSGKVSNVGASSKEGIEWKGSAAAPPSQSRAWGQVQQDTSKPAVGGWGDAKVTNDKAEEAGGWSGKISNVSASSNEGVEWKGSAAAPASQSGAWGQVQQGTSKPASGVWGDAKVTNDTAEDSWGKASGKWGNKDASSEWKSSADTAEGDKGKGWGDAANAKDAGGWKSSGDTWSKPKSFGGDDSGGNNSWGQSRSFDSDRGGFSGGRGSGGRRGRGRDSFGRGRGRSFDRGGNSSSWGKDDQDSGAGASWSKEQGGSWGGSSGNKDNRQEAGSWSKNQGGSWGNASGGSGQGNTWGGSKSEENNATGGGWNKGGGSDSGGWNKDSDGPGNTWSGAQSEDKNVTGGGWSKGGGSDSGGWNKDNDGGSWSKPGNDTWDKSRNFENDQGGRGSGGRRGRGGFRGGRDGGFRGGRDGGFRGGRDGGFRGGRGGGFRGGRGGGRDQGGDQFSSWKSDNPGGSSSSWGNASGGNSWSNSGGDDKGGSQPTEGTNQGSWGQGWSSSGGDDKFGSKPSTNHSGGWGTGQGSAWGNSSGGNNDQKATGQGSSWGNSGGNNNQKATGQGSSWGNSSGGNNDQKATGQGSSWGNSGGNNDQKATGQGSSWGNSGGNGQGSSWGNSGGNNDQKATGQGSSWGNNSGGNNDQKATGQGSSLGNSSGGNDQKANEGGNSTWGGSTSGGGGGGGWA